MIEPECLTAETLASFLDELVELPSAEWPLLYKRVPRDLRNTPQFAAWANANHKKVQERSSPHITSHLSPDLRTPEMDRLRAEGRSVFKDQNGKIHIGPPPAALGPQSLSG